MQCVNCDFFNIPGAQACGRCGTTLRFDQLNVSVEPPRAPKRGRWLRNLGLFWFNRARETAQDVRAGAGREVRPLLGEEVPPLRLFLRALVPGWSLRTVGAVWLGWGVLVVWLLLVFTTLLCLGLRASGFLIGLVFTVQFSAGLFA